MDVGPLASCVARIPSVAHLVPRHDHHILVTRLDLSSMGVASLAGWTIECSVWCVEAKEFQIQLVCVTQLFKYSIYTNGK